MSDKDDDTDSERPAYLEGVPSPVTEVVHLFEREQVRAALPDAGGIKAEQPVTSLCGAVNSYGPFREDADGKVCNNCERIREQRADTEA